MNKTIFVILFISCFTSCKRKPNPNVWTTKYEQGFYNNLDSVLKPKMPDKTNRDNYISYIIKRVKEELPNGLNSVSKDSLHNLNIRIGREYAEKENFEGHHNLVTKPYYEHWTPLIDTTIRKEFKAIFRYDKDVDIDKFCDCVITELKKRYPDSLPMPIPQNTLNNIGIECKNKSKLY